MASLPSLDCALGLRYLAARILMFLELRMDSARRGKSCVLGRRKEGDGEGVDGELGPVGGEADGYPGRLSHRERLVDLAGQGIKARCEGGSGGGRIGDETGVGSAGVDLGQDCEREDTVRIRKDAGSDVGEGGSNQGSVWVLREGPTGSVEPVLGRRERLWCLGSRYTVAR